MAIKLNLGCGPRPIHPQHAPYANSGWTLCDKYVNEPGIEKVDALDLEGYETDSVDEIYHSHLMEHLSYEETLAALAEWRRVLKPGGRLTINVPDMEYAAIQLLDMLGHNVNNLDHPTGIIKSKVFDTPHKMMEIIYGNQDHEGEFHKSGYTTTSIAQLLKDNGFTDVVVTQVFEAHDMGCLIVEAYKHE